MPRNPANRPDHVWPDHHHGREGSDAACQILLLLHKHRPLGLSRGDLGIFLGLPADVLDMALGGLKARGRIAPAGRGTAARWLLQQDLPRAGLAHEPAATAAPAQLTP